MRAFVWILQVIAFISAGILIANGQVYAFIGTLVIGMFCHSLYDYIVEIEK